MAERTKLIDFSEERYRRRPNAEPIMLEALSRGIGNDLSVNFDQAAFEALHETVVEVLNEPKIENDKPGPKGLIRRFLQGKFF